MMKSDGYIRGPSGRGKIEISTDKGGLDSSYLLNSVSYIAWKNSHLAYLSCGKSKGGCKYGEKTEFGTPVPPSPGE